MEYVLGCDVGSQGIKTSLVSATGEIVAEASAGYPITYPRPTWAEQPVEDWQKALAETIPKVLLTASVKPEQVRAIGLDAQVDGMVPVDQAGRALYPAIIWMDRRAVEQTAAVARECKPQEIFSITGLNLDPYHVAPKIRWFSENEPELDERVRYYLLPGSYLAYYLTGELGVDYSNASSTLLMDVRTRQWSSELCACFSVEERKLPPIYPANHVIGELLPEFAEVLGLPVGLPIVLGCGDEHAACLGAGVIEPGMVCDIAGTAEPVCAASEEPLFDETGLVETHCHAHPDQWLIENPGFVSGANYRWFREQFARELVQQVVAQSGDSYEFLNAEAEKVPPGSEGLILLPTLMGAVTPTWDSTMRGAFLGFSLSHTRAHFVRALLEGSAFNLRDITDRMQAMDLPVREIHAVGGGARSELWRQIKADVTGLPVTLLETTETTSLGAAILALHGAGLVDSLEEAVQAVVRVKETRDPNPLNQERYEACYQRYRQAYFTLLPYFQATVQMDE
jgi:xylulokinase